MICRHHPVNRILGTDNSGLIYIGTATVLRDRVWQFLHSHHNASWFLDCHRDLASKYLDADISNQNEKLLPALGKLHVRYVECSSKDEAIKMEKVAIFSYVTLFGEVPPLNGSMPGDKYEKGANLEQIRWFKEMLEVT